MIPQFLIMFRESIEAALIVSIVAAYLAKVGRVRARRFLYLGAIVAAAISLVLAAFISNFYGGLEGREEQIFEGITSLMAASVLTYTIVWMSKNARRIAGSLQRKAAVSLELHQMFGIFGLAFVSVIREGIETVLFLTPLSVSDPFGTLVGVIAGVITVLLLAVLTMGTMGRMGLSRFFRYTSVVLMIFAAGLVGYGVHELVEAYEGQIPALLRQEAWNVNPIDAGNPLHEDGAVGSLLKALVGYDGNPEVLRVVAYSVYWIIPGILVLRPYSPKEGRTDQPVQLVRADTRTHPGATRQTAQNRTRRRKHS